MEPTDSGWLARPGPARWLTGAGIMASGALGAVFSVLAMRGDPPHPAVMFSAVGAALALVAIGQCLGLRHAREAAAPMGVKALEGSERQLQGGLVIAGGVACMVGGPFLLGAADVGFPWATLGPMAVGFFLVGAGAAVMKGRVSFDRATAEQVGQQPAAWKPTDPRRSPMWAVALLGGLVTVAIAAMTVWPLLELSEPAPGRSGSGTPGWRAVGNATAEATVTGDAVRGILGEWRQADTAAFGAPQATDRLEVRLDGPEASLAGAFRRDGSAWREVEVTGGGDGVWHVEGPGLGGAELRLRIATPARTDDQTLRAQLQFQAETVTWCWTEDSGRQWCEPAELA